MESIAIKSTTLAAWQASLELIASLHTEEPLGDADCITGKYIARIAAEMKQAITDAPAGLPVVVELVPRDDDNQPQELPDIANIIATPAMTTDVTEEEIPEETTPASQSLDKAESQPLPEGTTITTCTQLKATPRGYEWVDEEINLIKGAETGAEAVRMYRETFPDRTDRTDGAITNRWCIAHRKEDPAGKGTSMKSKYPAGCQVTVVRCGSLHKGKVGTVQKVNNTQVLVRFAASGDTWIDAKDLRRI